MARNLQSSIFKRKYMREIGDVDRIAFQRSLQVTPSLISRIGLQHELEGHNGCVNCLEWNEDGSILASGSDDVQVILWDPFRAKKLTSLKTGHTGNIFSVKFLPNSNNNLVVSGAADCRIRVHDVENKESTHIFSCHAGRVKRLATAPNVPFLFWSAAEDGTVMQFDLRDPDSCCSASPRNLLINLNVHVGIHAEVKCLNINPCRPELMAVGANDPYVRMYDRRMLSCRPITFSADSNTRFPWERPALSPETLCGEDYSLPSGCAQYFVPGHLPQKQDHYREKFRSLVSTYLTFSPDGNDLLVNLGGEQVYLFDINQKFPVHKFDMLQKIQSQDGTQVNGVKKQCHGGNGISHQPSKLSSKTKEAKLSSKTLSPTVEALKEKANSVFQSHRYSQAILLYNQALALMPHSAVLYGNRAAAYIKRNWDGDQYAALRDCYSAIQLDRNHLKAHFRMAKCLFELEWLNEAQDVLEFFKAKFPDRATSEACQSLDCDIKAAIGSNDKTKRRNSKSNQNGKAKESSIWEQEAEWQQDASDYTLRFCGHCNTTTDIKEANFFGSHGQYIVAGSDDGSFFIWDRSTTNIVRVLRGDDSIVNCLQPHPSSCLLATSGIDPVVRLWCPQPEDGRKNDREVCNSDDAASANQKRMNADPLEMMLMNMGYRISNVMEDEDAETRPEHSDQPVQCRPS